MNSQIKSILQDITNSRITQVSPLSGGMISDVIKIDFRNHPSLVAKLSLGGHDMTIEAYMLKYLRENSDLPVPDVVYADDDLLIINYINGATGLNNTIQVHIGLLLGYLHQITSTQFGLERDTLIGPIHLPNPPTDSWIDFFREQRLLYMAKIALDSGNLPPTTYDRILTLADDLDQYLIEPDKPVLIHGDMWTTNILVQSNKVIGIIDPAIYYAHNEMELAYMTLFGTFGQAFFNSYQRFHPVDVGFFNTRRHILGLFPLLVHVKIFGGNYPNSVDSTLTMFGY